MSSNLTITGAQPGDLEYFKQLRIKDRSPLDPLKSSEVFSLLIAAHQGAPAPVLDDPKPLNYKECPQYAADQAFISKLQAQIQELKEDLKAAQNKEPEPLKIDWPGFIYTPEPVQFRNMQRYFAFMAKRGMIDRNGENLPQELTKKAINYFIKNEYPEVIK